MPIELTDDELRWILDYQMNNGIDQEPGFRAGLAAGRAAQRKHFNSLVSEFFH